MVITIELILAWHNCCVHFFSPLNLVILGKLSPSPIWAAFISPAQICWKSSSVRRQSIVNRQLAVTFKRPLTEGAAKRKWSGEQMLHNDSSWWKSMPRKLVPAFFFFLQTTVLIYLVWVSSRSECLRGKTCILSKHAHAKGRRNKTTISGNTRTNTQAEDTHTCILHPPDSTALLRVIYYTKLNTHRHFMLLAI